MATTRPTRGTCLVQQKRGSVLLMDGTLIHRGAGGPGRTIFFPFGVRYSRAWCGTPPTLGVVNMVGTRNFTCYQGAL